MKQGSDSIEGFDWKMYGKTQGIFSIDLCGSWSVDGNNRGKVIEETAE